LEAALAASFAKGSLRDAQPFSPQLLQLFEHSSLIVLSA
jgi:hypothetical protein